jgi:hypothetical protein
LACQTLRRWKAMKRNAGLAYSTFFAFSDHLTSVFPTVHTTLA